MKKEKIIPESKICTKCGTDKPIADFRTHKSGFILNQCRQCEKDIAKQRIVNKSVKKNAETVSSLITITTKKGKVFEASLTPIKGGRKASVADKVLYFKEGTTRDEARAGFSVYYSVPQTGISSEIVE
jgi:hypothetical protein